MRNAPCLICRVGIRFSVNPSESATQTAKEALARFHCVQEKVEYFLDWLGEGQAESVHLIGSRASGRETKSSDWDFLVVGEDFDSYEAERIDALERGELRGVFSIDAKIETRHLSNDIIFSSTPPVEGVCLWTEKDGVQSVESVAGNLLARYSQSMPAPDSPGVEPLPQELPTPRR